MTGPARQEHRAPMMAASFSWLEHHVTQFWAACVMAILALSLIPVDVVEPHLRKSWVWDYGHIVGYVALTFLTILLAKSRTIVTWRTRFVVYGAIIALGIAIELVQPYVGRHGNLQDAFSDAVGIAIGACCELLVPKRDETSRLHQGAID